MRRVLDVLVLAGLLAVFGCRSSPDPAPGASGAEMAPPGLLLSRAGYDSLKNWSSDRVDLTLGALMRHCPALTGGTETAVVVGRKVDADWWREPCASAAVTPATDAGAARAFFQTFFVPFAVSTPSRDAGAFTGYYEASLHASRQRDDRYRIPIYRRPPDLVTIDLGQFRPGLQGRLGGRLDAGKMLPYFTRRQIDGGALAGKGLEILWADDPVDEYFLEVQGSGRAELPDGSTVELSFDAQNGQPYMALGLLMVERGLMAREDVTMQSLRDWVRAHPVEGRALMEENPSFVFFKEGSGPGAIGTAGTVLTPGRSMAVDPTYISLGLPVWLDADDAAEPGGVLRRLLLADDTGSAIKGAIRGDVFWGFGADAAKRAGEMRDIGRIWLLVPKVVAARIATGS